MALLDLNASLIFLDDRLVGLSILAKYVTEADGFCVSFPQKLMRRAPGHADIVVRGQRLILIHDRGECAWFALPTHTIACRLNDLLDVVGEYAGAERYILPDGGLAPGFRVTAFEKKWDDERLVALEAVGPCD